VTTLTGSWKLGSLVIWFFGRSIIGGMASSASGWRVAVNVPLVTGRTIVGNRFMLAFQYIIFIVIGERGRSPTRCGGVAFCTIRREPKRLVIGIDTAVVILGMAPCTGIGCITKITSLVAFFTIIGNDLVCPRQRVMFAMVKGRGTPALRGMTSFASLWQLGIYVIGILR
jgi:hypothetical protein